MSLLEVPSLIEAPPSDSTHCHGIVAPHKIEALGASNTNFMEFIHTCTVKHSTSCSKSQRWPPKPVSLLLTCLNRHITKRTISAPVMPKMSRNRSALHYALAQGASNRDITVYLISVLLGSSQVPSGSFVNTLLKKSLSVSAFSWSFLVINTRSLSSL